MAWRAWSFGYPADFDDQSLLADHGLGVSSINVRSRRSGKWWRGSFTSASRQEREEVVDDFKKAMNRKLGVKS
jgi:hypothetical protein